MSGYCLGLVGAILLSMAAGDRPGNDVEPSQNSPRAAADERQEESAASSQTSPKKLPTLHLLSPGQISARPGEHAELGFHWDAVPMEKDYRVLVNFVDAGGKVVFNGSHGAPYPFTSKWNGAVKYRFKAKVPADLPTATYQIVGGLYDSRNRPFRRQTLQPGTGVTALGNNEFLIGTLVITGGEVAQMAPPAVAATKPRDLRPAGGQNPPRDQQAATTKPPQAASSKAPIKAPPRPSAGQTTTILKAEVTPIAVRPGDTVEVVYRWQALPMDHEYLVFAHFLDSKTNKHLFSGDYKPPESTTSWSGPLSHLQKVVIPPSTPEGDYKLLVGLYRGSGAPGTRPALAAADGIEADGYNRYHVATLTVSKAAPASPIAPPPPPPVGKTTVLPLAISPSSIPPGYPIQLRYRWQSTGRLASSNAAFAHFVDDSGKTVFQHNHQLPFSTTSVGWVGDIEYEQLFVVPAGTPDGTYKIYVGLDHKHPDSPGRERELLAAGPGVTEDVGKDEQRRYLAGTLSVSRDAPRPKADTEGPVTLDLSGYKLAFNEEFDQLDVSARGPNTRWTAHTPWGGDFGDAKFADPSEGFPFTVKDGILRIEARKGADGKWQSGLLASVDRSGKGFAQQYGYFEMRAKLPKGPGVWPAFWLVGVEKLTQGAKVTAEVDVLEHYGLMPNNYTSVIHTWHRDGSGKHDVQYKRITTRPGEVAEQFHNYGVMTDENWTIFFFDQVEVWRTPTPAEHRQPMFLLLNLALGGGWPVDKTPNPSHLYVDHVRVYSK